MPINIGDGPLGGVFLGSQPFSQVYVGSELFWAAETIYIFDTPGEHRFELPYATDLYMDVVVVGGGGGSGGLMPNSGNFRSEGGGAAVWTSRTWEVRNGEVVVTVGSEGAAGEAVWDIDRQDGKPGEDSRVTLGTLSVSADGGRGGKGHVNEWDPGMNGGFPPGFSDADTISDPVMPFMGEELSFSPHGNGGEGALTEGDGSPGHTGYVWIRTRPR